VGTPYPDRSGFLGVVRRIERRSVFVPGRERIGESDRGLEPRAVLLKEVATKRGPASTVISLCSLYAYTRALFSDDADPLTRV
jgi:hypothetical protein